MLSSITVFFFPSIGRVLENNWITEGDVWASLQRPWLLSSVSCLILRLSYERRWFPLNSFVRFIERINMKVARPSGSSSFSVLSVQGVIICPASFIRRLRRLILSFLPCLEPKMVVEMRQIYHKSSREEILEGFSLAHGRQHYIFEDSSFLLRPWMQELLMNTDVQPTRTFSTKPWAQKDVKSCKLIKISRVIGPVRTLLVVRRCKRLLFHCFFCLLYCFLICMLASLREERSLNSFKWSQLHFLSTEMQIRTHAILLVGAFKFCICAELSFRLFSLSFFSSSYLLSGVSALHILKKNSSLLALAVHRVSTSVAYAILSYSPPGHVAFLTHSKNYQRFQYSTFPEK